MLLRVREDAVPASTFLAAAGILLLRPLVCAIMPFGHTTYKLQHCCTVFTNLAMNSLPLAELAGRDG
jgi:hypothetical protein